MKQVSVFVENRPGSLMEVTSKLMEAEINIRAVASFDTPEFGILRMVVDQPERAKETLTRLGFVVRIYDVVGVELKDEKLFFSIVKASFMQRRKTLSNGLVNGGIIENKAKAIELLKNIGLEENVRGEELTLEQFANLSNKIYLSK